MKSVTIEVLAQPLEFAWLKQTPPSIEEKYAIENCVGGYLDPLRCGWYHRNWGYLRSLNLLSNPYWHPTFYLRHFGRALARTGFLRVLICGTADDALLSLLAVPVLQMIEPKRVSFTVIDTCLTPLMVCRDFSNQHNLNAMFLQADARNLPFQDEEFDVVASDAFLGRFRRGDKESILAQWHRILRPGGLALTTARLADSRNFHENSEARIMSARERLQLGLAAASQYLRQGRQPWSIVHRTMEYSGRIRTYPFTDEGEIARMFQSHGFDTQFERPKSSNSHGNKRMRSLIHATKLTAGNSASPEQAFPESEGSNNLRSPADEP